jgi:hypothetical protein
MSSSYARQRGEVMAQEGLAQHPRRGPLGSLRNRQARKRKRYYQRIADANARAPITTTYVEPQPKR